LAVQSCGKRALDVSSLAFFYVDTQSSELSVAADAISSSNSQDKHAERKFLNSHASRPCLPGMVESIESILVQNFSLLPNPK
jgi:hypothetical protein